MLLRLVSHPKNNKSHVDKMIFIEGIPENLIFENRGGRKVLRNFLLPENPENLPKDIRKEFFKGDQVTQYIPPFEKGAEPVFFEKDLYGIIVDYNTRQGADLWQALEKMIEDQTPRDHAIPAPVVVAKDYRTPISISSEDVPVVRLVQQPEPKPLAIRGRPRKEPVEA